jgi:hypothetical protein
VYLLALMLLDLTAFLAEHCLLLSDLQQQLRQFAILLHVLGQPGVLVLQRPVFPFQQHRLGECLGGDVQQSVLYQLLGGPEVLLRLEVQQLLRGVHEDRVFVELGVRLKEVEFALQLVDFLHGRGGTPWTMDL